MSYLKILEVLKKIHDIEPDLNFGRIISTSVTQGNMFSLNDEDVLSKLKNYLNSKKC